MKRWRKFNEYSVILEKVSNGRLNDLAGEASKRLRQMKRILSEAIGLNSNHELMSLIIPPIDTSKPNWHDDYQQSPEYLAWKVYSETPEWRERVKTADRGDWLEIVTEAFYWTADRVRTVVRKLPGLSSFNPAGVRDVRNKLLGHPEGADSGVLISSFAWGGQHGPVIKAMRYDHQQELWKDAGLFVNANEFLLDLAEVLDTCLADRSKISSGIAKVDARLFGPEHGKSVTIVPDLGGAKD